MKLPNPLKFLPDGPIIFLCRCGPVGTWGRAPGTSGSVLGLVLFTLCYFRLPFLSQLGLTLILALVAVALCDEGERRLQKRDPGEIILDEVVAVPLCFLGIDALWTQTGYVWIYMIIGFILFRLFDIVKPFGIKRLQNYPGGIGVVLDDLAAAVATNRTIRLFYLADTLGGWEKM